MNTRNNILSRLAIAILTIVLFSTVAVAETATYRLGEALDFPCVVSSSDNKQPRTIILPNTLDKVVDGGWSPSDLEYQGVNNTISFQLHNPSLTATIQVYDVTGQLYLVSLRAAAATETPDPSLTVVNKDDATAEGARTAKWPADTDSATAKLARAMLSGITPDGITVAPFSSNVNGKVVSGSTLFEDDFLLIRVQRMWLAPNLKGYETVWTWKGDRAVRINIQRLYFPGLIAIHSPEQTILSGDNPEHVFQPKITSKIYMICVP